MAVWVGSNPRPMKGVQKGHRLLGLTEEKEEKQEEVSWCLNSPLLSAKQRGAREKWSTPGGAATTARRSSLLFYYFLFLF